MDAPTTTSALPADSPSSAPAPAVESFIPVLALDQEIQSAIQQAQRASGIRAHITDQLKAAEAEEARTIGVLQALQGLRSKWGTKAPGNGKP